MAGRCATAAGSINPPVSDNEDYTTVAPRRRGISAQRVGDDAEHRKVGEYEL
jgi:hypothetical protein